MTVSAWQLTATGRAYYFASARAAMEARAELIERVGADCGPVARVTPTRDGIELWAFDSVFHYGQEGAL